MNMTMHIADAMVREIRFILPPVCFAETKQKPILLKKRGATQAEIHQFRIAWLFDLGDRMVPSSPACRG
jgi:hypothetical protein